MCACKCICALCVYTRICVCLCVNICVCVCECISASVCVNMCVHTSVYVPYVHMWVCECVCMAVHMCLVCTHMRVCVYMGRVHMRLCVVCACMCVYMGRVHMCLCVCVHACVHIHALACRQDIDIRHFRICSSLPPHAFPGKQVRDTIPPFYRVEDGLGQAETLNQTHPVACPSVSLGLVAGRWSLT